MSKWKIVSHGGTCDYCGGREEVTKWRHEDTGETYRQCGPCQDSVAAARRAEK